MMRGKSAVSLEEIREKLKPVLEDRGLQLIVLFGSGVSGRTHRQSDIDLAFLFDRPMDILELTNKIIRLLHTDNIDVVDLKRASPLLKYSVVKNGMRIYEREQGLFHEFYSLAFRMYIDAKKLRDAQATVIKRFIEARGPA